MLVFFKDSIADIPATRVIEPSLSPRASVSVPYSGEAFQLWLEIESLSSINCVNLL